MLIKKLFGVSVVLSVTGLSIGSCVGDVDDHQKPSRLVQALTNQGETEASSHGDVTPELLRLRWENVGAPESSRAQARRLTIENVSDVEITVTPLLRCNGLMKYSFDLELGSATIKPGGQKGFVVPAAKLPIQTSTGVAQASLDVKMEIATPDGPVQRQMVTSAFYYRHSEDYQEFQVFSQRELLRNGKARLYGFGQRSDKNQNRVVGRIANGTGGFRHVKEEDFAVVKDGVVVGYEMGMEIE